MDLTCPKCQASMRTYERNGVNVDQCTECRGIFLDRGELERLVDAEGAFHAGAAAAPSRTSAERPSGHQSTGQAAGLPLGALVNEVLSQAKGHKGSSSSHPHRKKQSSFLGELFG